MKGYSCLDTLPPVTYMTHSGIPAASALRGKGQRLMQEARPTSGPIWKVVPGNQVNSLYKEADAQPRRVEEGRGNGSELGCHGGQRHSVTNPFY